METQGMKVYFATIAWDGKGGVCMLELSSGEDAGDATATYEELLDSSEAEKWADIQLICVRNLGELHEKLYGEPPLAVVRDRTSNEALAS
jgi:hypothetical protein